MREALRVAREGAAGEETPVAAVLAIGGEIAGRGEFAHRAPRPYGARGNPGFAQAAARMKNYRLPGSTLYCTLEPCVMCAGALVAARVERLVFGARDLRFGGVRSKFRCRFGRPEPLDSDCRRRPGH